MHLDDLRSSKFLKRSDVGRGVLVTIKKLTTENVAKEGEPPDFKHVAWFVELEKPLVLNGTNGQIIASINGHESDIDKNWPGTRVVLYDDPNVAYKGRLVGGIRIRAPRQEVRLPPPPPPPPPPAELPEIAPSVVADEDLPF